MDQCDARSEKLNEKMEGGKELDENDDYEKDANDDLKDCYTLKMGKKDIFN